MSAPLRLAAASVAMLLMLLPAPRAAEAQIRRCTGGDGNTIFTDRACADIDAVERVAAVRDRARAPYRGGCQRRLQDLVFEVTSAIDAGDTNRLASVYHWPGTSSRSGYAIVDRLDAIAQRPLVDISALRPEAPVAPAIEAATPPAAWSTAPPLARDGDVGPALPLPAPVQTTAAWQASSAETNRSPRTQRARAPVALRLEQTLTDGITPSRTTLGLRRHMDCWWISL